MTYALMFENISTYVNLKKKTCAKMWSDIFLKKIITSVRIKMRHPEPALVLCLCAFAILLYLYVLSVAFIFVKRLRCWGRLNHSAKYIQLIILTSKTGHACKKTYCCNVVPISQHETI